MLMGMPSGAAGIEGIGGVDNHFQCIDIEVEVQFWLSNLEKLKWSPLEADTPLLVELIKFGYDGYVLYGGVGYESSWMFLMTRFKASNLSRKIRVSYAEFVFTAVWSRVFNHERFQESL